VRGAWTLILKSAQASDADAEFERNRLGAPAYEGRMRWQFGNRLKGAVLSKIPTVCRMLTFSDGPRVSDYAEHIELKGNEAGPPPDILAELITDGKRWTTVRVSGSESARRVAWLSLSARGVRVLGYEPSVEDTEQLKLAIRDQPSSPATQVEWNTAATDCEPSI
jgi:hypothetical protein